MYNRRQLELFIHCYLEVTLKFERNFQLKNIKIYTNGGKLSVSKKKKYLQMKDFSI